MAIVVFVLVSEPLLHADLIGPGSPGWTLVRRADKVGGWHPATDSLAGTDVYGTVGSSTSDGDFSVNFESAVPGWDQFLFITGDQSRWMVMDRSVLSSNFENSLTPIISSYLNPNPHSHLMYNRAGFSEDPWLSALDHSDAIGTGNILYGEASFGGEHASNVLPVFNGANVFIRNSANVAVPEPSSLVVLCVGAFSVLVKCRRKRPQVPQKAYRSLGTVLSCRGDRK